MRSLLHSPDAKPWICDTEDPVALRVELPITECNLPRSRALRGAPLHSGDRGMSPHTCVCPGASRQCDRLSRLQLKSRNKRNTQKSTSNIPENDIKMQQDDRSKETVTPANSSTSLSPIPYVWGSQLALKSNFLYSCLARCPWQPSAKTVTLACSSSPRSKVV
ncbi:hypothetical protein DBR06_SOUSAS13810017 [Sousa chinensis]|nr:hypothetical protein DBR06_SOUSAS13810017 [Sousa chinensis]